ncbi:MarR family winged helix-turn-helix transcriptional regulator [Noviherbaspirillum suwonense]|jgi:MarR family transcriptional regulator for hemolysin|uniref:Transcriptional regulator, MarR family n=1 Tax=Noviherbaspirillum suwonense TaxID=1224511 RepID=A0ABY1QEB9_9BURK|nr:MarR family transcriptional regulator [Noviherbaspirillum suwonense]SMP65156.1 transcriptional regulator, MarR family [Noviherbaspirillum suwonense]
MDSLDHELMRLTMSLTAISRAYKAVADQVASGFGLSQATAWPVVMIARLGGGVRPGALADALGLEPSSLVRVIDQLIASGLVERRDDASDRRARTLHLSPQGQALASQLEEALVPFRRTLFERCSRQDIAACGRVLDALSSAIDDYSDAAGSRQSP